MVKQKSERYTRVPVANNGTTSRKDTLNFVREAPLDGQFSIVDPVRVEEGYDLDLPALTVVDGKL